VSSATNLIFVTVVRPVLKFIGWFATIHALTLGHGAAMEFHIEFNPEEKISVIIGEGAIIAGDATRLEAMLGQAGRDQYGNIVLYLDSPGGSVAAAFEMVKIMDREEFSALVASSSICASACASIVYISARFHQILGSGKLGIHTCYYTKNGPTNLPEPAPFCNEQIAKNAYEHGTSYGAVNMWQKSYGAESMAWIGQDVACKFGLCGPPGFDATLAVPSFDCKLAKRASELAICSNKRLARHEASLVKTYLRLMEQLSAGEKIILRSDQRAWLSYRDACGGAEIDACLLTRLTNRERELAEKLSR
jgi:uncharacterized protein YecT (DUF1311 family)